MEVWLDALATHNEGKCRCLVLGEGLPLAVNTYAYVRVQQYWIAATLDRNTCPVAYTISGHSNTVAPSSLPLKCHDLAVVLMFLSPEYRFLIHDPPLS